MFEIFSWCAINRTPTKTYFQNFNFNKVNYQGK